MSRKVQRAARQSKPSAKSRKPDARSRRTCERLGSAMIALIQEKPVAEVTIQEVLDRASSADLPFIRTIAIRTTCFSANSSNFSST